MAEHFAISRRGLLVAGAATLVSPLAADLLRPDAAQAYTPQLIYRGNTTRKEVAFSFDAGSDAGATARILDILRYCGITASFALTGNWVWANETLSRRIVARGHHLINHSMTHPSFTGASTGKPALTRTQRWRQLDGCETSLIRVAGGRSAPWFRPPYGDIDRRAAQDCADHGWYRIAMWTVDSLGWKGTPWRQVRDRCLSRAQNGCIYLFHVGSGSTDVSALASIVTGLTAKGYRIVSVRSVVR